jgi:hypothetical protein
VLADVESADVHAAVRDEVRALTARFPLYPTPLEAATHQAVK